MNYNNGSNLNEMYDYYLGKTVLKNRNNRADGIWKKYGRGSDYKILLKDLEEKNTNWDIVYKKSAKGNLSKRDIYIYYTKDKDGVYKKPNLYIITDGNDRVLDIELSLYNLNFTNPSVSVALAEKVGEFSNRGQYVDCMYGIYMTNKLVQKINNNMKLDKEDIRFLYNMDSFTWSIWKRNNSTIDNFNISRDFKSDLAYLFDCNVENIGTELEDFHKKDVVCYLGNIQYDGKEIPDNFKHLKYVKGDLILNNVEASDNLGNLEEVGSLSMWNLKDASGLHNFKKSHEEFNLSSLKKANGLEKLEEVGFLGLNSLEDALGLGNLKIVHIEMYVDNLIKSSGLGELMMVKGKILSQNLQDASGFEKLEYVDDCPAEEFISDIEKRSNSLGYKVVKMLKKERI